MTGQEFRDVLRATNFFLSDFAAFVGKSRWWANRISTRTKLVAPRWIVKLSEFLQSHNLSLNDFYPKVVFDDTNIELTAHAAVPSQPPNRTNTAGNAVESEQLEAETVDAV